MDNTGKFTQKAEVYSKYRPTYPSAFIQYLFSDVGFSQDAAVADVGAGTGILTLALADLVKTVYAIEPNRNMRRTCMDVCGATCSFVALDGTAEDTGLPDQSVDFITVAQAFHWFDLHRTHQEFSRILKPDGLVVLVWNSRIPNVLLTVESEQICRKHCPGFRGFSGGIQESDERFVSFFRDGIFEPRVYENNQVLHLEAFIGLALSASYAPLPEHSNYQAYMDDWTELFHRHAIHGQVTLPMQTRSYTGRI